METNNGDGMPRLWISRVALFESPEKADTPIRNIIFHRGLNIIWGVELSDDIGIKPVTLSGHSVGKTLLCRMIRYCLGESNFGNSGAMARIQHSFPKGWVGMELCLEGQIWSVLRTLKISKTSKAAQSVTIEELFDQDCRENNYKYFLDHLQKSMLAPLQAETPPDTDKPYKWEHLLAWLTRDQESRFQSLHDWRSPRSGADMPKFQKPKEHALYLMRLVLNLIQTREVGLSKDIAAIEREIQQREKNISKLQQEPKYRFNEQEAALKRLLNIPQNEALNADSSDMTSDVYLWRLETEQTISNIEHDIEKIERSIVQKRLWLASYNEEANIFRAMKETIEEATEFSEAQEPEDDTIQKLRGLRGKHCDYGNIPFSECSYMSEYLAKKEDKKIIELKKVREERRVASETESRINDLEKQEKKHAQIVELLKELRQKLNREMDEKRKKEFELVGYRERLQRLDYHLIQRQQGLYMMEGRTPNTHLQQETDHVKKLLSRR